MRITEILSIKKPAEQLKAVQELVKAARAAYGNSDSEISTPTVPTTEGSTSVKYLTTEDKAAVAVQELRGVIATINNADASLEGFVADYEVVSLIATNAILCTLDSSVSSKLI